MIDRPRIRDFKALSTIKISIRQYLVVSIATTYLNSHK